MFAVNLGINKGHNYLIFNLDKGRNMIQTDTYNITPNTASNWICGNTQRNTLNAK